MRHALDRYLMKQENETLHREMLKKQAADLLEERKLPDILVKHSPTFKPLKPFKP